MARVYASSIINASADKVWQRVRGFNDLPKWHPRIRDSRIEDSLPEDKVSCIRNFNLQNGDNIREQLLALSDYDKFYTYSILESPMPLTDYVATLRLTPVTDGEACFIEWFADFECSLEVENELCNQIAENVFQGGFDALKRHFG